MNNQILIREAHERTRRPPRETVAQQSRTSIGFLHPASNEFHQADSHGTKRAHGGTSTTTYSGAMSRRAASAASRATRESSAREATRTCTASGMGAGAGEEDGERAAGREVEMRGHLGRRPTPRRRRKPSWRPPRGDPRRQPRGERGGKARVREGVARREEVRSCGRAGGAVVVGSQRKLTRRKGWTRGECRLIN